MSYDPPSRQAGPTSRTADHSASASTPPRIVPPVVERVVRWHPAGEPIPDGWRAPAQRLTHHHRHAILIEQVRS